MPPGTCGLRNAALLLCPGQQDWGGEGLAVSAILVGFTELLSVSCCQARRWADGAQFSPPVPWILPFTRPRWVGLSLLPPAQANT